MSFIDWSDDLSVGIAQIDSQHKKLVELVNTFNDAMVANHSKEAMQELFDGLVKYTASHFATEERLFEQYNYPGSDSHKKSHNELVDTVVDLKNRYEAGKLVLSLEIMKFLKKWLTEHILGDDMAYSDFLISKGVH